MRTALHNVAAPFPKRSLFARTARSRVPQGTVATWFDPLEDAASRQASRRSRARFSAGSSTGAWQIRWCFSRQPCAGEPAETRFDCQVPTGLFLLFGQQAEIPGDGSPLGAGVSSPYMNAGA